MLGLPPARRRRLSEQVAEGLTRLCGGLVAAIVVVMAIDLVGRNMLGLVIPSTAEIATLLMIYAIFIGSAVAVQRNMHFLIFEPRDVYAAAALPWLEALVRGVLVAFSTLMIVYGTRLALAQMGQLSAAMQIPYGLFYLGLPVGGVLTIVFAVLEPLDRSDRPQHEVLM